MSLNFGGRVFEEKVERRKDEVGSGMRWGDGHEVMGDVDGEKTWRGEKLKLK